MNTHKLNINLSPTVFLRKLLKEQFIKYQYSHSGLICRITIFPSLITHKFVQDFLIRISLVLDYTVNSKMPDVKLQNELSSFLVSSLNTSKLLAIFYATLSFISVAYASFLKDSLAWYVSIYYTQLLHTEPYGNCLSVNNSHHSWTLLYTCYNQRQPVQC
jgi:hypothetical protein